MSMIAEHSSVVSHISSAPLRALAWIFNGMVQMSEASTSMQKIAAYQAMSDEELAARGMKREDIVSAVFPELGAI